METPQKPSKALSTEQLQQVRAGIERMRETAMTTYRLQDCNDYLQLAWLFGCSDKHVCQRNDCVSYRYDGPDCDHSKDNYITITDSECTLTINVANKVTLRESVSIPLHDTSPKLAEFLRQYRDTARELQRTNAPYTMCTIRERERMKASYLTTRAPAVWKKLGLDFAGHSRVHPRTQQQCRRDQHRTRQT